MKKLPLLVLLLFLLPLIPCSRAQSDLIIEVERDIRVEKGGLVYIDDLIEVSASSGSVQLTDLNLGFHESYGDKHRNFTLGEDQELEYTEVEMDDSFSGYRLDLPEDTLLAGESVVIHASYLFVDTVFQFGNYSARLPIYPGLEHNISSIITEIQVPEGSELLDLSSDRDFTNKTTDGQVTITHNSSGIQPLANSDVIVRYTPPEGDLPLIDLEYLERGINIFPAGIEREDTYIIINRGNSFSEFNITLPEGASDIRARDSVGPLDVDTNSTDKSGVVGIAPRSVIYQGYRWEFTVIYEMPSDQYITQADGSKALEYTTHKTPYYIKDQRVRVTLPKGGKVKDLPVNASLNKDDELTDVVFKLGNTIPDERHQITLNFNLNPIAMYQGPLTAVFILALLLAGVYVVKSGKIDVKMPGKEVPQKIEEVEEEERDLEDLAALYEERLSLLKEMEKTEKELSSGSIDPPTYDSRMAELRSKTQDIMERIKEAERTLLEIDPSLEEVIGELREIEEDLSNLDRDLNNLETRYRAGRIARRDFYSRRRSLTERRSEAIKRIEDILEELR